MSENAIRVQLPGGDLYAPALTEAAVKTAARSSLSRARAKVLMDIVNAGVAMLNSGKATVITLEMQVHDDHIAASLVGKGCRAPTKKLVNQLQVLADKKARSFETKSSTGAHTLRFEV